MKTKLSFLALPFLGLVLTVALVACGSDGGGGTTHEGNSSGSNNPLPPVESDSLKFEGLKIDEEPDDEGIIKIRGFIRAIGAETRIVKLEFSAQNTSWISYNGNPVNGAITGLSEKQIVLGSSTEINLKNPSMACGGPYNVNIKACTDNSGKFCAVSEAVSFSKPDSYCRSSSSAVTEVSSSSEAGWKFGSEQAKSAENGGPVTIGSGAFTLQSTEEAISVNLSGGCNIRDLGAISFLDGDQFPRDGKTYNRPFAVIGPAESRIADLSSKVYYLIYCGEDKYLIWFLLMDRDSGLGFDTWPKPVKYWPVTESP